METPYVPPATPPRDHPPRPQCEVLSRRLADKSHGGFRRRPGLHARLRGAALFQVISPAVVVGFFVQVESAVSIEGVQAGRATSFEHSVGEGPRKVGVDFPRSLAGSNSRHCAPWGRETRLAAPDGLSSTGREGLNFVRDFVGKARGLGFVWSGAKSASEGRWDCSWWGRARFGRKFVELPVNPTLENLRRSCG